MADPVPSSEDTTRRFVVQLPALLWGAGLLAIAILYPQVRTIALASVLAGVTAMVLLRRSRSQNRTRSGSRSRAPSLWPDASVKSVVEAIREPAFVIDRTLALRFSNEAARRVFGDIALGDPISLRFRVPDLLQALEGVVATGESDTSGFTERQPVDRSWGIDILPIRAAGDEHPAFFLLLFRDHTQARRLERMRTDFVANASHELRTPLASLTGFIETLKGPARDDEAARVRFLDIMQDQARRMSRLIDDLLSLSRIETKRRLRSDETVDLSEVLAAVVQQVGPYALEQGVDLLLEDAGPRASLVNGDRDELIQVFSNLTENACKYGGGGGRVVVGLRHEADAVEAYVQDFGRGIAPQHVPRLTERFYRVEDGTGGMRGTGLGLSIVRNVLTRHRTRLSVASILGEGSTFSVRFNLRERAEF